MTEDTEQVTSLIEYWSKKYEEQPLVPIPSVSLTGGYTVRLLLRMYLNW